MTIDVEELVARAEIEDALLTYCRGIDRLDAGLIRAAFHEGAMLIDYGPEPISIDVFAQHATKSLADRFVATQHRVTNLKVEREGNRAIAEAYVLAFHVEESDAGRLLHTFNGRYIDTCEDRGDGWRIAQRILRVDWSRKDPWNDSMSGSWPSSARDQTDVVYEGL